MKTIELTNDTLTASFDEDSGALVALTSRATGWNLIGPPEAGRAFALLAPATTKRSVFVFGEDNAVKQVSHESNTVTFTWERPVDSFGNSVDLTFCGRVELTELGLEFTAELNNRSDRMVEVVVWPYVGGLQPPAPDGRLVRKHQFATSGFMEAEVYPHLTDNQGYWGTYFAAEGGADTRFASFALLDAGEEGLYLGYHDQHNRSLVRWYFQQKPGLRDSYDRSIRYQEATGPFGSTEQSLLRGAESRAERHEPPVPSLELLAQRFSFVAAGSRSTLPSIALSPYAGPWHRGAAIYRQWRRSWFTAPRRPAWSEEVHSWLQIQIYGAEDEINFRYTDLPAVAESCARTGIEVIQLTGWAFGGQDRGNPSHAIDPALGTEAELRDAVAACRKLGVRVVLFCKWVWVDQSQPYYPDLERYTAKNPYGYPYPAGGYQYFTWTQLAGINTRPLVPMCSADAEWHDHAADELENVLRIGADGLLFDEVCHHGSAVYCFDPAHSHPAPAYLYAHDIPMVRRFKEQSAAYPEFLYAGELLRDELATEYHLSYCRFGVGHTPVSRYVDSELPIMMAAQGFDDRNKLNKCLEYRYIISYEPYNFKGRPEDAPLTISYGQKIDALRRRYRDLLWDAEYCGPFGAEVSVDGADTHDFSVFRSRADLRAVVVCNTSDREVVARVRLDSPAGAITVVTPEAPEAMSTDGTLHIPARSVAVVLERE